MSYTTGIPRSGQSLGNSRPQVQGNFDYINTAFAVNHVAFNAAGVGKHIYVQMPERDGTPSKPIPTTAANEGALYTKEAQSITNLFWRQESNGTEVQLTNIAPSNATSGYSFLPGGFLIQWDLITLLNASTTPVTFPTNFDAATTPYSIQLTFATSTPSGVTLSVSTSTQTNTGFTIRCSPTPSGSPQVYYIAIGKRTT